MPLKYQKLLKKQNLVTLEDLVLHEKDLDHSNSNCYVPIDRLRKLLSLKNIREILAYRVKVKNNIKYTNAKNPICMGSLNSAFVWSHIIEQSKSKFNKIVELGPGKSIVIDMALSFLNFQGIFTKIDNTKWEKPDDSSLKKAFKGEFITADVVKNPDAIPASDIIIMNHFLDDLFMDLWAKKRKVDYFGPSFHSAEKGNEYWKCAIKENGVYIKLILSFVKKLATKVNLGGYIIIRNFPSAFETVSRQVERINFTTKLNTIVVEAFLNTGFTLETTILSDLVGFKALKYPDSFFVLKKQG